MKGIDRRLTNTGGLILSMMLALALLWSLAHASSHDGERSLSPSGKEQSGSSTALPRQQWGKLRHQSRDRSYLLYTPDSYTAEESAPLVVVLHGGLGNASMTADRTGFNTLADRDTFLVLYPEAVDKHWNDGRKTTASDVDDVAFINALVEHVAEQRNIDRRRIYVTGLSNGGIMTMRLACQTPDRFAAFASVIANLPVSLEVVCHPAQPVRLMMINGTADPLMPWAGGEIRKGRWVGLGGTVLSVQQTADFWADINGCNETGDVTKLPDRDPDDDTRIEKIQYSGCQDESGLVVYQVDGGGHTWPGSKIKPGLQRISGKVSHDMNASEVIWGFFNQNKGQ